MSDAVSRRAETTTNVLFSSIGNAVNPVVAALIGGAIATGHPDLAVLLTAPSAAFAGALSEHGLKHVTESLRARLRYVEQFAEDVKEISGKPIDEFIDDHVTEDAQKILLGDIVDAVADAGTAAKIRLLAAAFVHGARSGDAIEDTGMYIRILKQLEPAHVRLIGALFREAVAQGGGAGREVNVSQSRTIPPVARASGAWARRSGMAGPWHLAAHQRQPHHGCQGQATPLRGRLRRAWP